MSTIPTSLTQEQFEEHVLPHLSTAKRGFVCQIPLYQLFNYILYRLHTGCQWAKLPILPSPENPQKKRLAQMLFITIIANGVGMEV